MSRTKRARSKARKRAANQPSRPEPARKVEESSPSRTVAARHRATVVKLSVGTVAAASLAGWMGLARVTYAGHPKHPARPLAIPPSLYDVVRHNLLQAGILAPATAPPDATTSSS